MLMPISPSAHTLLFLFQETAASSWRRRRKWRRRSWRRRRAQIPQSPAATAASAGATAFSTAASHDQSTATALHRPPVRRRQRQARTRGAGLPKRAAGPRASPRLQPEPALAPAAQTAGPAEHQRDRQLEGGGERIQDGQSDGKHQRR